MANKLGDRSTRPHRAPHNKFSSGQYARAISDRSGLEFPYREMVREWNGSLVHFTEFEPKQPQLQPRPSGADAISLRHVTDFNFNFNSSSLLYLPSERPKSLETGLLK